MGEVMKVSAAAMLESLDVGVTGTAAKPVRLTRQIGTGLGVATMVLQTHPALESTFGAVMDPIFWTIACLFALEYVARLALAPWTHWAYRGESRQARLHYA